MMLASSWTSISSGTSKGYRKKISGISDRALLRYIYIYFRYRKSKFLGEKGNQKRIIQYTINDLYIASVNKNGFIDFLRNPSQYEFPLLPKDNSIHY